MNEEEMEQGGAVTYERLRNRLLEWWSRGP